MAKVPARAVVLGVVALSAWFQRRQVAHAKSVLFSTPHPGAAVTERTPAPPPRLSKWRRLRGGLAHAVPPLWLVLLALTGLTALLGFWRLPPTQESLDPNLSRSALEVWVDRPNVRLVALLDARASSATGWTPLYLFVDTPGEGLHWAVAYDEPGLTQEPPVGPWLRVVTAQAPPQRSDYGSFTFVSDLWRWQAWTGATAELAVRPSDQIVAWSGSHLRVETPTLELGGVVQPNAVSPTGRWYQPQGEVIILAPLEVANYRGEVTLPPFASEGAWRDPNYLFPYWRGTDPVLEASEQRDLFLAGLLFGIAGSALIGSLQEFAARARRDKAG